MADDRGPEIGGAEIAMRMAVLRPYLVDGVPLARVATDAGISIRTARRWIARYRGDRSAASSIRPWIDRPRQSSFQIIIVSPARAKRNASVSPGRSIFAPLALSVNSFSHPALVRASSWSVKF
jgi:Homeodomain-like domain